jgi:hypothetical protein
MTWHRNALSTVATIAGAFLLVAGALMSHGTRTVLNGDAFADRAAASLSDPRVADFLADRITTAVVHEKPDLIAFRPVLLATTRNLVASAPFRSLVRVGARRMHDVMLSRGAQALALSVPDVDVILRSALTSANPALAEKIPARLSAALNDPNRKHPVASVLTAIPRLRRVSNFAPAFLVVASGLLLLGLLADPHRQRGLMRAGFALVATGLVLLVLVPLGRVAVASSIGDPLARGAAAGVWDAAMAGLRSWAFLIGGIGLVLAAAGGSLMERLNPAEVWGWCRVHLFTLPAGRLARASYAAFLVLLGLLAVSRPSAAAATLILVVGASLTLVGLREFFAAVLASVPQRVETGGAAAQSRWALGAGVVILLAVGLAAAVVVIGRKKIDEPVVTTIDACNGAPELCDRPLDRVAFAGTHNAMSAADIPDWLFPQQEKSIGGQLQDGVRAVLFDVYYGLPTAGRIKSILNPKVLQAAENAVGPEGVAAAMRIRERLVGETEGPRGLYMCHGFCELGAVPLSNVVEGIRDFLIQNPNEVLILVIEDYVEPADLIAGFEAGGLGALVYRGGVTGPWPSLRELIELNQRVVVFAEHIPAAVGWLQPTIGAIQETPYTFHDPAQPMSCAPNRGGRTGTLFQINHWIETTPTPKPSNAAIVNAYDYLFKRAQACRRERRHLPNIVAVDFYGTGDLMRVVRALNGLETQRVQ